MGGPLEKLPTSEIVPDCNYLHNNGCIIHQYLNINFTLRTTMKLINKVTTSSINGAVAVVWEYFFITILILLYNYFLLLYIWFSEHKKTLLFDVFFRFAFICKNKILWTDDYHTETFLDFQNYLMITLLTWQQFIIIDCVDSEYIPCNF